MHKGAQQIRGEKGLQPFRLEMQHDAHEAKPDLDLAIACLQRSYRVTRREGGIGRPRYFEMPFKRRDLISIHRGREHVGQEVAKGETPR